MAGYRIDRITEDIKRELIAVLRDVKDPRVGGKMLSIVKVDVSKIALTHDGGGHIRAAGFSLAGEQAEVEAQVLAQIAQALKEA